MEHGGDIYGNQNIELDFSVNLSPAGPPEAVPEMLRSEEAVSYLNCYPDPECRELTQALSRKLKIPVEWILCGNGASELLMAAAQAVRPAKALIPVPTYQGYERVLRAVGAEPLFYSLEREKGFALSEEILESDDGLKALVKEQNSTDARVMVFLCNPNNPVGSCIDPGLLDKIAEYCRANHIYLVVDECYMDLLPDAENRTMCRSLSENPYLIIINAFTKAYAMPGIRLGYLMTGNVELLRKIQLCQPEWSVSMTAQRAGVAALADTDYLPKARKAVCAERKFLSEKLRELGAEVFGGEAPFILFYSEAELYEHLREKGILIRRCDEIRGIRTLSETGGHYYRIGIRSHAENAALMEIVEELLEVENNN